MSALCLSWSLRHCWFGLFLHWAFTAGLTWQLKEQHTECICLCFLLYFTLYPGPPPEKKQNTTHIRRIELTWTILSLPFQKSAHAPPLPCITGKSPAQTRDSLWASFVEHTAMRSLISVASQIEIRVYLRWVSDLLKLFKCDVSLCLDQMSWLYLCC